jgi:ferrous iron transport protein B
MAILEPEKRTITVALAGQPNVGKSTVISMLTGLSQHVGNWPGKTIERKAGTCHCNGLTLSIVDLPGIYSLTVTSPEERVARDFIFQERPDAVSFGVGIGIYQGALLLGVRV